MKMYKTLIVLVAVSLAGTLVHAQADSGVTVTTIGGGEQQGSTKNRNVVIVNQSTDSAKSYEKQPTTVVEAAPLTNSHADDMRKSREATEVETEQRIVEKLEQSRIEDEKRRQQKILGTISGAEDSKREERKDDKKDEVAATVPTQVIVVQPAQAPAPQPAPAPVVIQEAAPAPAPTRYAEPAPAPEELHNAVRADLTEVEHKRDEKTYYFGGTIGQINYHTSNVNSFGAVFLSLGEVLPSNWNLSVDLGYANSNLEQGYFVSQKLDQYMAGVTARYEFLTGKIRPSVGGTIDYVRRQYSGFQDAYGNTAQTYNGSLGSASSNAVDAGGVAAVDVLVSDNLRIGLEYKYMTNIGYKYDGSASNVYNSSYYPSGSLLETHDYDLWSFVVRYTF